MVSGAVTPPRLDLANEDLVRAHVQAIWLTETGQSLGSTLCDILDVNSDEPSLELLESVQASVNNQTIELLLNQPLPERWFSRLFEYRCVQIAGKQRCGRIG